METSLREMRSELEKTAKYLDELKEENLVLRSEIVGIKKSYSRNAVMKEEKLGELEYEIPFEMAEIKEPIQNKRRDSNDDYDGQVARESTSELDATGVIAEDAPKWTIGGMPSIFSTFLLLAISFAVYFCLTVGQATELVNINENLASMKVSLEGLSQRINSLEDTGLQTQQKIVSIEDNVALLWIWTLENAVTGTTSCGGYVEVAPGIATTVRYPERGNYSNNERCVWSIRSTREKTFESYRIKVNSFSMEKHFDGVIIYYWDFTGELQSQKITTFEEWILINAPNIVMTFGSDGSNVGEGFHATIAGVGTLLGHPGYNTVWLYDPKETYSYPVGSDSDSSRMEMRVLVQPRPGQSLKVSLSTHIVSGDSIHLYLLTCSHKDDANYQLIQRKSEEKDFGYRKSSYPVLVIFRRKFDSWFKMHFE